MVDFLLSFHNKHMMKRLALLMAPVPVVTSAQRGIDPDAKEAIAFAILAVETMMGRPGNVPGATGAYRRKVLGKICPA